MVTWQTHAGFVSSAPDTDPGSSSTSTIDNTCFATRDTTPEGTTTITEIGWWCDAETEESNFEVGIYTDSSDSPNSVVGSLSQTNAKGTTSGWKRVTGLNIEVSASTAYWIAIQLDNTATGTITDRGTYLDYSARFYDNANTALPSPTWNIGGTFSISVYYCIYAVASSGAPAGNVYQINIGDEWKTIEGMQINIGDVWKTVEGMQINIGDTWKEIF